MRVVVCEGNGNNTTPNCLEQDRPPSSTSCNTHLCPDQVEWKYGDWSQVQTHKSQILGVDSNFQSGLFQVTLECKDFQKALILT